MTYESSGGNVKLITKVIITNDVGSLDLTLTVKLV
jgi:hypothetical protein